MDMTIIIAIAFATYLLTTYLVYEDGPFNACAVFRFFAGINVPIFDMNGEPTGNHVSNGHLLAELLSCHKCTGFWVGAVMVAIAAFVPEIAMVIGAIGMGVFAMDLTHGAIIE